MRANIREKVNRPPSILVTAGPTREKIDPVRFISNYSTGTFGYEIAKEAKRRGCRVTLISGPTCLNPPRYVKYIQIENAAEMRKAAIREFQRHDCLIMAAAVSDWRVRTQSKEKIKKRFGKRSLELVENPDILRELGSKKENRILVGFALETEDVEKGAVKKLKEKKLDFIVANRLTIKSGVFGDSKADILIIDRFGNKLALSKKSKKELAKIILDKIFNLNIY